MAPSLSRGFGACTDAGAVHIVFSQIARLELDDLLTQLIERAQDVLETQGRLRALLSATRAVSEDLSLPLVLTRIVESARQLIGAGYGAIGVLGPDGSLEQFIHTGMDADQAARLGQLPTGRGILGLVIDEPQPIRLDELSQHPSAVGFPPGHPPMRTFLGVPIRVRDRVFGNIYMTEKSGGRAFTDDDQELLIALAGTAAVAIEHAQLFTHAQLRQEVLAAVAELSHSTDVEGPPWSAVARHGRRLTSADLCAVVTRQSGNKWRVVGAEGSDAAAIRGMVLNHPAPDDLVSELRAHGADVGPALQNRLANLAPEEAVLLFCRENRGSGFSVEDREAAALFADQAGVVLAEGAARRNAKLVELLSQRDAIARDMNEHVVSRLFALGIALQGIQARIADGDLRGALAVEVDGLDETIKTIRTSIFAATESTSGE